MDRFFRKKLITPITALFLCLATIIINIGVTLTIRQSPSLFVRKSDYETLFENAVLDAMNAEKSEIMPLFPLEAESEMTTFNQSGERVLLLGFHNHPEVYVEGTDISMSDGEIWCFTDKEIASWYKNNKKGVSDWSMRFKQLVGLSPQKEITHISAFWARPGDVIRPAHITDVSQSDMTLCFDKQNLSEYYKRWFDNNILSSYYEDLRPWTRLGYTYDWAKGYMEYGLSEFIIEKDSDVIVEFTKTINDFVSFLNEYESFVPKYANVKEKQKKVRIISPPYDKENPFSRYLCVKDSFEKHSNKIQLSFATADTEEALNLMVIDAIQSNMDVVYCFEGMTTKVSDIMSYAANNNPKVTFVVSDKDFDTPLPENLSTVSTASWEGAFLAGFAAAKASKSGIVGFIGGEESEAVKYYEEGFKKGVSFVNNNSVVLSAYTGSFTDEKAAEWVAKELYGSGADIIFEAAGDSATGIFKAAERMKKQSGKYIICSEYDKTSLSPDRVLLSIVKNTDVASDMIVADLLQNGNCGGKNYILNLENGGLDIAANNGNMNDRIYNEVLLIKEKITSGAITLSK